MNYQYKISMAGVSLSDAHAFLKVVFPRWNGEPYESNGAYILVTFDTPQTPADLGPLVRVELISE
jgi:hypothetical protein